MFAHVQNDIQIRRSNAALFGVAKDLETNQVSINKVNQLWNVPGRMLCSWKKRMGRLYGPERRDGQGFSYVKNQGAKQCAVLVVFCVKMGRENQGIDFCIS